MLGFKELNVTDLGGIGTLNEFVALGNGHPYYDRVIGCVRRWVRRDRVKLTRSLGWSFQLFALEHTREELYRLGWRFELSAGRFWVCRSDDSIEWSLWVREGRDLLTPMAISHNSNRDEAVGIAVRMLMDGDSDGHA